MTVQIIKGVIPPVRTYGKRKSQYPFEELEVGDMFFVPTQKPNDYLRNRAVNLGKKLNRKFITRVVWMEKTPNGWVTGGQNVQGVGVWRTA